MMNGITLSNWINLGLLCMTALVGILAWLGSRKAAREARADQEKANEAAVRSADAAEEATYLQRRSVELEEQRQTEGVIASRQADVTAEYQRNQNITSTGKIQDNFFVVVKNAGKAPARNLHVEVDGVPADDHKQVMTNKPMSDCTIGPGGELRLRLTLQLGGGLHTPFDVAIYWDDDSGVRGHWKGTLS